MGIFISIGDYLINSDDIRWLSKSGNIIEIAFKNERDVNSIEVEYDNKDELEAEWKAASFILMPQKIVGVDLANNNSNNFFIAPDPNITPCNFYDPYKTGTTTI